MWIGVIRRGGVQPDHAALADHIAFVVESLHADVIKVAGAMNSGARIRLRQDQQLWFSGKRFQLRGQFVKALRNAAQFWLPQNSQT